MNNSINEDTQKLIEELEKEIEKCENDINNIMKLSGCCQPEYSVNFAILGEVNMIYNSWISYTSYLKRIKDINGITK